MNWETDATVRSSIGASEVVRHDVMHESFWDLDCSGLENVYLITLHCQNLESLRYIVVADSIVYLHSNFRGGLRKTHVFWQRVRNGPSRSSKVVDFGTNRKRVCDFLFVINSNLGPILPRFRDIAGFLRRATPPIFHPNFRGVPFGLDCRCCFSEERRP